MFFPPPVGHVQQLDIVWLPTTAEHKMRRMSILHAGGLVMILKEMEARRREAQGGVVHKLQAAAQRVRKAQKASRDKKNGQKDAEDALHEDTAGNEAWIFSTKYTSLTTNVGMLVESLVLVQSLLLVWNTLLCCDGCTAIGVKCAKCCACLSP